MLAVQQLREPLTRAEGLAWVLELVQSLGFETTGWQDGRIQKTLMLTIGTMAADVSELAKQIVEFGFNDYASGDPLNEFSKSRFSNTKTAAVKTQGPMKLTSTAQIPYTVEPGQLGAATANNIQFRNVTGGIVPAGGNVVLTWDALVAGEDGNVALGAVNKLLTPLAGVTVSNSEGTPWYTTAGKDEEPDRTIRVRNSTQWSRLSVELIREAYENIALEAGLGVVKIGIDDQNPRGPGTIDVYPSLAVSLLGAPEMAALQIAYAARTFGTDTTWLDPWPVENASRVAVRHPPTQALVLGGTLYHDPAISGATAYQRADLALRDFLRRTPIGGWDYGPGPTNVVTLGDLLEVLENVEGMRTIVLAEPTGNTPIGPLSLVVPGWNDGTLGVIPVAS